MTLSRVTNIKPKKLYKGKKRYCMSFLGPDKTILKWALTVNVGDYIGTCEGCNRKVKEIKYVWVNVGDYLYCQPNHNWVVNEVIFIDTNDRIHYCPGGNCVYPKKTPEYVKEYFEKAWGQIVDVDDHGEIIGEAPNCWTGMSTK